MVEFIGVLLIVQGAGGLLNRLIGSHSLSWFIQLHVLPPALHIPASILLIVAGGVVLVLGDRHRKRKNRDDQ